MRLSIPANKMNEGTEAEAELDFSAADSSDHADICLDRVKQLTVHIPLPSFGVSNSHIDLCGDLLDASWALERLAAYAGDIETTVASGYYRPNITAVMRKLKPGLNDAIDDCALLFCEQNEDDDPRGRIGEIRNRIGEYEEELHRYTPRVPEIVDWYFANLVGGAIHELRSEAPEYYSNQILKFPERQVGYYRSAYSHTLGGECYASNEGWLLPNHVNIDKFFKITAQKYRIDEFIRGNVIGLDGKSLITAPGLVADFPIKRFLRSQICAGFVACRVPDDFENEPFSWLDHQFAPFPRTNETLWSESSVEKVSNFQNTSCLIDPTGTLIILGDRSFQHLLYDTSPLSFAALKRVREYGAELVAELSRTAGMLESLSCNWATLTDEEFEQLCYDMIFRHPKYDSDTIRKLGKSRSRDGGRDIEVFETSFRPWEKPKKWIFQCKLIKDGSSLGARRVSDIGDMLEQYDAQGFGVLTSAPIDSTLYDKLDSICGRRGIDQFHMSVFELERALSRNPDIKSRFFGQR